MSGAISDFLRFKDGSLRSFDYHGRRIRLDTLQAYLTEAAAAPSVVPPAPPAPSPEDALAQFVRIGKQARPVQKPNNPGVNTPGIIL